MRSLSPVTIWNYWPVMHPFGCKWEKRVRKREEEKTKLLSGYSSWEWSEKNSKYDKKIKFKESPGVFFETWSAFLYLSVKACFCDSVVVKPLENSCPVTKLSRIELFQPFTSTF